MADWRGERSGAVAAVALGAMIIGLAPIGMRLSDWGPQATALWRFVFAVPGLAALALLSREAAPSRRDMALLLAAGFAFGLDIALWHAALAATTVANATLFSNMTPILAAAAGVLLFRERLGPGFLSGAAVALTGALLLGLDRSATGQGRLEGDLIGLSSAVFYAAYLLILRGVRDRVGAWWAMLLCVFGSIAATALSTLITGEAFLPAAVTAQGWMIVAGLGLFVHVAGQGLIALGLGRLPLTASTVLLWLQPISAAFLAWALFGERLGAMGIVGAGLVLAGIWVVQRARSG